MIIIFRLIKSYLIFCEYTENKMAFYLLANIRASPVQSDCKFEQSD